MTRSHKLNQRAPAVAMASCHPAREPEPTRSLALRAGVFAVLAVATLSAVALVWPRTSPANAERSITVTMGGFSTPVMAVPAGQPTRLQIVNPDSSAHADGGGWHQLAIPALGVDARVPPRSDRTIELPAAAPGEYAFYCDVCCGGKENPAMQGVLKVVA